VTLSAQRARMAEQRSQESAHETETRLALEADRRRQSREHNSVVPAPALLHAESFVLHLSAIDRSLGRGAARLM